MRHENSLVLKFRHINILFHLFATCHPLKGFIPPLFSIITYSFKVYMDLVFHVLVYDEYVARYIVSSIM
jgi:hypothetical protein